MIHQWSELAQEFTDGLVLGNGASIAFDQRFSYSSLRESAKERGLIAEDVQLVFDHLATADFELVLRMLWHAKKINEALKISDPRTATAYSSVREALIKVVRSIHVGYDSVVDRLPLAAGFMRNFETVVSLNYDLLAYWAILVGNKKDSEHKFKDCFVDDLRFRQAWQDLRKPISPATATTIVGYPHGNLALAADLSGNERKIGAAGSSLLETIFEHWTSEKDGPVFVSEGTSEQKLASIRRSPYLATIYTEMLASMKKSVVLLGWSISDNDIHLLDAICGGGALRYAYAVNACSLELAQEQERVRSLIKSRLSSAEVLFFERDSPGCWLVAP